jgi:F-type H+-transporting ATPase subunit b
MLLRVAAIVLVLCGPLGIASAMPAVAAAEHPAAEAPAAHGGHGGGHGASGGPLDFQTDLALWTGVVFVVLFLILKRFAWGPISRGLESRERMIADQIAQAERSNEEARRLLAEYQQKLVGSQEEVRTILEQARRDAEQSGRQLLDQARNEAKREQEKAVREIDQAKDGALKELAEQSATLAVSLAGKILGAQLKAEDHSRLISQSLANFPKGKVGQN